jgi:hypothetical protein
MENDEKEQIGLTPWMTFKAALSKLEPNELVIAVSHTKFVQKNGVVANTFLQQRQAFSKGEIISVDKLPAKFLPRTVLDLLCLSDQQETSDVTVVYYTENGNDVAITTLDGFYFGHEQLDVAPLENYPFVSRSDVHQMIANYKVSGINANVMSLIQDILYNLKKRFSYDDARVARWLRIHHPELSATPLSSLRAGKLVEVHDLVIYNNFDGVEV